MKRSNGKNCETQISWMSKLFKRLFVTKERTNKDLERSFSFGSRQHRTKNNDKHNNLMDVNSEKSSSSKQIWDPKSVHTDIIRSR